jgi:hypothetical protein
MTQTTHMAVRDAIIATLLSATALAGGRVVGNRRRPMAAQDPSQIYVYLEESTASRPTIGTIDWHTRIRIECVARTVSGTSAEDAADALAVSAYARIMADPSLGSAAIDTQAEALAWLEDEADTTLSACQQLFTVWHATPDTHL